MPSNAQPEQASELISRCSSPSFSPISLIFSLFVVFAVSYTRQRLESSGVTGS